MEIRIATVEDAGAVRDIYAPYVLNTAVSLEYNAPDKAEIANRICNTLREYPYLVAVNQGEIVGYAYAGTFRTREAYRHASELSVYVKQDCREQGIGKALYNELIKMLVKQGVYSVHACIVCSDEPDEHLTDASIKFHTKMGFEIAGRHKKCGFKFGKWYNIVIVDKEIREKTENPAPFIPYGQTNKYSPEQKNCLGLHIK